MLDHAKGTLTANSAIITDANSKIDNLKVDNLDLNGNTISSTDTNGNINLTPNGTGKTVITNAYIGDTSTSLQEYIQDVTGGQVTAGNGIDVAYDDTAGTSTVSLNTEYAQDLVGAMVSSNSESGISVTYDDTNGKLDFNVNDPLITITGDVDGSATMTNLGDTTINVTLDTVNTNVGSFGSTTKIPTFTVNGKGLVTAAGEVDVATNLSIAGDTGTDTVSLLSDTLTVAGGEGVDVAVTNNTITISGEDASSSNKGIASFSTTGFSVTAGAVSLSDTVVQGITTDSGAMNMAGNAITILGGEGVDVTHSGTTITIAGEVATGSNLGVASFNSADFSVSAGAVSIKTAGVGNAQLENSSVTIGSTTVSLGGTSTTLAGITQLTVDNLDINGNTISATDTNGSIFLAPNGTGSVDVSGKKITNLAEPVAGTDAATKNYVDNSITGLTWKSAVNLLADTNVALTGSASTLVIDGHAALDAADSGVYRILLKNQTTSSQNGIYVYTEAGSTYTLVRADDADTYQELIGTGVYVMEGVTYGQTGWTQANHYLTAFSGQQWVQFSGAGAYSAGAGLGQSGTEFFVNVAANGGIEIATDALQLKSTIAGTGLDYASGVLSLESTIAGSGLTYTSGVIDINLAANSGLEISGDALQLKSTVAGAGLTLTAGVLDIVGTADRITVNADSIDIASTYIGQSSITTLGTITTGTWNATTIAVNKGGTGLTSYSVGDLLVANGATSLAKLTIGTSGQVLQSNGTTLVYGDLDGGTYA
jgi:hypothetical protein